MHRLLTAAPRTLALDAALGPCSAALVQAGAVLATRSSAEMRGAPSILPGLIAAVLAEAPGGYAAVAVTVGPGSFTGIRAALALAHGLGLGAGVPVLGVTVAEAIRAALPSEPRPIWVVIDTRRGRVFLERDGRVAAYTLDDLPIPDHAIALGGDAAEEVAARLAARGADVTLTPARAVQAGCVGLVGLRRLSGELPPLVAQPAYVDPPEARAAAPLRPAPV